jgi:MoaA/NifB/PqqE/SkfB family radical SAM enzyme
MDNLCVLPWVSLETSPLGSVRPCCLSYDHIPNTNLKDNTLEAAFKSDFMKDLRQQFRRGEKPEGCKRCWNEEASGRVSKRMNSTVRLKKIIKDLDFTTDEGELRFIDFKLGNICNLKCRICGSYSSSKWAQEEIDIQKSKGHFDKTSKPYQHLEKGQWPRNNNQFWENLEQLIPNLRYLEFTGGEPFLIKEHFQLLQKAVEMGYSKNIEIHYNTNGTTFPEEGIELWPHFKLVEIAFSIDDIGSRFEYQRYGAIWDNVNYNIERFQNLKKNYPNIQLQHCLTINVFNIFYLKDLMHWMQQQTFDSTYFNVLHDAVHFSIRSLPDNAKQEIVEIYKDNTLYKKEVDDLITFMLMGESTDCIQLKSVIRESDKQRKQNLQDNHLELAEALDYE